MLVDKTIKVEGDLDSVIEEVKAVAAKVAAGVAPVQALLEEAGKLPALIVAGLAVPGDFAESLNGCLRSLALGVVDVACIALKDALADGGKKVRAAVSALPPWALMAIQIAWSALKVLLVSFGPAGALAAAAIQAVLIQFGLLPATA